MHVSGRKVNENYTETMLSNGGTYAPYIAISSSVKYKLNKSTLSKTVLQVCQVFGLTMLGERNAIQNSTDRSGHILFMYRNSFCLLVSSFTKLTYSQKHTCYMNNFKTSLLVCRGYTVTFIIIKVLIVTSYLLLYLLPLCYQWWDTLLL